MDTGLKGSLFACFLDFLIQLLLSFFYHFLNAGRMDTTIIDEFFEGHTGHFPTNRIESGNDDRFRRIVDDEINPSEGFQRTDIAAFAANDPAFHLIVGERNNSDRRFSNLIGSTALDSKGNNFPCLGLSCIAGFLFHVLDEFGLIVLDFFLDTVKQFLFGFVTGQSRNSFEFPYLFGIKGIDTFLGFAQTVALFQKFFFLFLIGIHLAVDIFFLLDEAAFALGQFCPALLVFPFHIRTHTMDFFLGFNKKFLLFGITGFFCFCNDLACLFFCFAVKSLPALPSEGRSV